MARKLCSRCRVEKSIDDLHRDSSRPQEDVDRLETAARYLRRHNG